MALNDHTIYWWCKISFELEVWHIPYLFCRPTLIFAVQQGVPISSTWNVSSGMFKLRRCFPCRYKYVNETVINWEQSLRGNPAMQMSIIWRGIGRQRWSQSSGTRSIISMICWWRCAPRMGCSGQSVSHPVILLSSVLLWGPVQL